MPNDVAISPQQFERATDRLARFVDDFGDMRLFSTGAQVVQVTDPLFNVSGSTPDPEIDGLSWKGLLQSRGITGDCYADTPEPGPGTSHPGFKVGGHMTLNSDGSVAVGGTCFLMPLCSWHNSTARDGVPFEHERTDMLELSGYMQSEPAAFFTARMDGLAERALIYVSPDGLVQRRLAPESLAVPAPRLLEQPAETGVPPRAVLLRRHEVDGEVFYQIEDARLGSGH